MKKNNFRNPMIFLFFLFSSMAFADTSVFEVPLNSSYLNNTQNNQQDLNSALYGGSKHEVEMIQNYQDQTRFYYLIEPYNCSDISTQMYYMNQIQNANKSFYSGAFTSARQYITNPYIANLRASDNNGEIAEPIKYTAGGIAFLTGNAVDTTIKGVKVVLSINVQTQMNSLRIESILGNFSGNYNPNAPSDAPTAISVGQELYQLNYSKTIPGVNCNVGANYTGSTQVARVSLSRQIWDKISGEIDNSWGNESVGIMPEVVWRMNYGVKF